MNKEFEEYINALKEVEKENDNFELTLSKSEVLFIVKNFEQLEKEVNEYHKGLFKIKKQTFDGKLLLKDVVKLRKEKEQLENIRKEAIECIETDSIEINTKEYGNLTVINSDDLLNILNKGSDKE